MIKDDVVFIGSEDSNLYAIDIQSGDELWKKKTSFGVRSVATINDSLVYFSSGNDLYAVYRKNGEETWKYSCSDSSGSGTFDPWDYHVSSPVFYFSYVFVGFGNGMVMGFDQLSGHVLFKFRSLDASPVRSTPVVKDNVVYFGDWNGRIYAVKLSTADTLWTYKTYEKQPYPTFGQLNTSMLIYDSLLIFGARNPEFQVLNTKTGKKIWSHIEIDGGWISGDPLVYKDTLFVGGSDNHKLFAFDVNTGDILWTYEFLFNNFSKPVIKDDLIFFTTGDAYAFTGDNPGNGYLYALNRRDGSIKNMLHFEGSIFNSPAFSEKSIIVGGDDMMVSKVGYDSFVHTNNKFQENGQGPVKQLQVSADTIENKLMLSYQMNFDAPLKISVLGLDGERINLLYEEEQQAGEHNIGWDGKNGEGLFVPAGYYFFEARSGIFIKNIFGYFPGE